jgi:hypothetical protein
MSLPDARFLATFTAPSEWAAFLLRDASHLKRRPM